MKHSSKKHTKKPRKVTTKRPVVASRPSKVRPRMLRTVRTPKRGGTERPAKRQSKKRQGTTRRKVQRATRGTKVPIVTAKRRVQRPRSAPRSSAGKNTRHKQNAEFKKRSKAAKLGWKRRKQRPAKHPGKRFRKPSGEQIQHLVTVEKAYAKAGPRGGRRKPWTVKRDILIPAPRGTSKRDLLKIARATLPKSERYALKLNWKTTIAEGPKTRARKAKLR